MYGAHPGYALSYARVKEKHRGLLERFYTLYEIDIPPNSGKDSNSNSSKSSSSSSSSNNNNNKRENRTTLSSDLKKYVNNSLFSDITILFGSKVFYRIYPFYSIIYIINIDINSSKLTFHLVLMLCY